MNDGAEDDVSHKLDLNENGLEDATLPLPAVADEGFQCYLKTRKGHFKQHIVIIKEGVLLFYRSMADKEARQQQLLSECHLRLAKSHKFEQEDGTTMMLHPVQADILSDRTRLLYFANAMD